MKIRLTNGETIKARWIEFWHNSKNITIWTGDELLLKQMKEINKIEE